jgi:hypothetical protein
LFTAIDSERKVIALVDEQRRRAVRRLEEADATAIGKPRLRTAAFAPAAANAQACFFAATGTALNRH